MNTTDVTSTSVPLTSDITIPINKSKATVATSSKSETKIAKIEATEEESYHEVIRLLARYAKGASATDVINMFMTVPKEYLYKLIVICLAAAIGSRKTFDEPTIAKYTKEIMPFLSISATISNKLNFTLLSFAGHMLIKSEKSKNNPAAKAFREKIKADSIWDMNKDKALLSDARKSIILEFATKHPVDKQEIENLSLILPEF
jgi:hypothetical protein